VLRVTELDPELKARVLEFVRERRRVTVTDVREEFFPGDIPRPYLYLDALTAEDALFLLAFHDSREPTTWIPGKSPEGIAGTTPRRKPKAWSDNPIRLRIDSPQNGKIPWPRLVNGNTYRITNAETRQMFGVSVVQFRSRLSAWCRSKDLSFRMTRVKDDAFAFRIEMALR
jgi:hypothetical protein